VRGPCANRTLPVVPRTVVSAFDKTGNWSRHYREAGYDVVQLDLQNGQDVRFLPFIPGQIHGVILQPPCTYFTNSGARWKRTEEEMAQAMALVDAGLRLVALYRPEWWVLENPVGKLSRWLGPPRLMFDPCEYGGYLEPAGDAYTKRTCLWGDFAEPPKRPVTPVEGSKMWRLYGGKSMRTKNARSATPLGFARAFFEANP
jgi:hypothetical protein